jgi:type IV secretory pathway TrbD component
MRDAAVRSATCVWVAILFGVGIWIVGRTTIGLEYFAC